MPAKVLDWAWSFGGLLTGAGVVYGTIRTRLTGLETRLSAVETRQKENSDEVHRDIGAMRSELKGEIRAVGEDLKDYMRDMMAARGKP